MDDLLKRLDDAANDTHYIDHITAREAAARIRELEAQLAETRAEVWRRAVEAAARECEAHALWIERESRHGVHYPAAGVLRTSARDIRALPMPDDLK